MNQQNCPVVRQDEVSNDELLERLKLRRVGLLLVRRLMSEAGGDRSVEALTERLTNDFAQRDPAVKAAQLILAEAAVYGALAPIDWPE